MPRFFRNTLYLALFLTSVASPALARMVIGVTPTVTAGVGDPTVRGALEAELSSRLGETVVVRSFDSEAAVLDWLIRFRELDAALVGSRLMQTLPAGTLLHLADLPPAAAVTHPGIVAGKHETLSRAFRSLFEDERGRQLLSRLAGTKKVAAPPKTASPPEGTQAIAPAAAKPATTVIAKPAAAPTAAKSPPLPPTTEQPPAKTATASSPAKTPAKQPAAISVPARPTPAAPAPAAQAAVEPASRKRTGLLLIAALVIMIGISVKIALLMRHWQQKNLRPATPPEPPSVETFDYQGAQPTPVPLHDSSVSTTETTTASAELAPGPTPTPVKTVSSPVAAPLETNAAQPVVLRVNMGAKGKVNFDFRTPTPSVKQPEPALSAASTTESPAAIAKSAPGKRPVARRKTTEDTFPPADDLVVEQGRLGKTKVPALFKRCAELPQPVVLRVRAGDNETAVHFAAGQICHASSRNWRIDGGTRQWSKLGYLMVRDGLISETQRDQALELIERQPGLRFTTALQQLGLLDLEALRQILARQAKTTIYSLILFSSGEYRIEADGGAIPAEESIALQVEALIREASHHQSEWTAIRRVLPNLGTRLDFTPDGREKLEQVRLSVHQQLLLSQVDGQTQIGTLCCDSTMMDYEACRFLYLMVKAGVLQVIPAA